MAENEQDARNEAPCVAQVRKTRTFAAFNRVGQGPGEWVGKPCFGEPILTVWNRGAGFIQGRNVKGAVTLGYTRLREIIRH
jgi:hypothetical protein